MKVVKQRSKAAAYVDSEPARSSAREARTRDLAG